LAVFDFDQTISESHVYYALAGGPCELDVEPPYTSSEHGQLAKMGSEANFVTRAFGGNERIAKMTAFFETLTENGVESIICSRGSSVPSENASTRLAS